MNFTVSGKKIKRYLFVLLVLSLNFGEYVKVSGIALSQCFALLLLVFSVSDIIKSYYVYNELQFEDKLILFEATFWGVISFVQVFWVGDFLSWKSGIRSLYVNLFICLEMCVLFREDHDYTLVMRSVNISLYLSILAGLYEIFKGVPFDDIPETVFLKDEVRTFFGNPNDCATWIILCLLGSTLYCAKCKKSKLLCLVGWSLGMYVIYHTGSRAGILSVFMAGVSVFVGYLIYIERKTKEGTRSRIKTVHILGIMGVGGMAVLWILGNDLATLIGSISNAPTSDVFRLRIIKESIEVAMGHMLMGAGAGQTTFYVGINPHNFLLELFSDYGIVVAVVVVYIIWKIFMRIFESCKVTFYEVVCFAFVPTFLLISIASSSMARLRMVWVVLLLYYFVAMESGHSACNMQKNKSIL